MKRIDDPKSVILHDTVVLLGRFDGFHVGHQRLLHEALRLKAEHAANCPDEQPWSVVVFTFDVYPGQVFEEVKEEDDPVSGVLLKHRTVQTIQTHEERLTDLISDEADYLLEFPFNRETMSMEPEQFVERVLVEKLGVRKIVCGYDFRFGKERKGDVKMLRELGNAYGFDVLVVPKVMIRFKALDGVRAAYDLIYDPEDKPDAQDKPETREGKNDRQDDWSDDQNTMIDQNQEQPQEISSTLIREEIRKGHMEQVAAMLGRPFYITGEVLRGKQLGRTIGFPTVNQKAPDNKILPPDGVYATRAAILDATETDREQTKLWGVTNIGIRPTFDDGEQRTVETFLLDYHGDLYGKNIRVEFMHYLRPEQKFESIQKLQEQMKRDVESCKEYIT